MIKIKKLSIALFLYLLASCGSNNISDIQSLEQKALEIPPNFELKPPSDNESELTQETIEIEGGDITVKEILNSDSNNAESTSDDTENELLDILTTDSNNT